MIIRRATLFDHTGLLCSICDQIKERVTDYPEPNGAIGNWINNTLQRGIVFVAEEGGKIIGTIGMGVTHFPWNDEIEILTNEWLHVDKQYRKDNVASKLIDKIKQFADERKIIVVINVINDKEVKKVDRFLEMKGMRYMGGNFIYKLGDL